jgi:hypothetical protein
MRGRDLANQGQSDTAPLALGREERHEYPVALIVRDPGTVVCHCDDHPAALILAGRQCDATGRHISHSLDGVSHQIDEGLIQKV